MSQEDIRRAIERLSDRDVYYRLMFASTPEALRVIIESLPGVKELIAAGPEAKGAVLEFFDRPETQSSEEKAGIALYLLQRLPSDKDAQPEATQPVARFITSGNASGFNQDLAAQAFLATSGIEDIGENEDPVAFAFREAENYR